MHQILRKQITIACAALCCCGNASATEGGGNAYALGLDTNGAAVMPPEGLSVFGYYHHYEATHIKDDAGRDNARFAHFKLTVNALATRVSYVWPGVKLMGANVESRIALPFAVRSEKDAARATPAGPVDDSGSKTGFGEIQIIPLALGWHAPTLHQIAGIDAFLPTGRFVATDRVNIGRNYYQVAPFYAFMWTPKDAQLSAKIRYGFSGNNKDNGYSSGDEFTLELSAGYQVKPSIQLGFSGYFYRQATDDTLNGALVNGTGNRGRVNALGPYISYKFDSFTLFTKLQKEFDARNRPEGTRLWVQAKIPL
ncbi:MAG: transporter [Pseudomonadota bacterium]